MTKTVYIAPAVGTLAGQCRIYATHADVTYRGARDHYRKFPQEWKEVGLMNFQGRLVCYDGTTLEYEEIKDCEPLMAGTVWTFED